MQVKVTDESSDSDLGLYPTGFWRSANLVSIGSVG
jgi:hypothetical protein